MSDEILARRKKSKTAVFYAEDGIDCTVPSKIDPRISATWIANCGFREPDWQELRTVVVTMSILYTIFALFPVIGLATVMNLTAPLTSIAFPDQPTFAPLARTIATNMPTLVIAVGWALSLFYMRHVRKA